MLRVRNIAADAYQLHAWPEAKGAVVQVASQFNLLEMPGYDVTPEDGVSDYEHDHTQGPACAIAIGPATIYRNYFAPVEGQIGQTRDRQIDTLADLVPHRREIVAVNRRRSGRTGAGRTLSVVVLVITHAILGRHLVARHFQQVELRSHLYQGPVGLRPRVQLVCICCNVPYLQHALRFLANGT